MVERPNEDLMRKCGETNAVVDMIMRKLVSRVATSFVEMVMYTRMAILK